MTTIREQILNQQPAHREHVERLNQARNALTAVRAQAEAERIAHAEAAREHRAAVLAAAAAGTAVPPDPPAPSQGLATALTYAQERVMSVSREGQEVKAEVAAEVETRAREEHDRIIQEVTGLVAQLSVAAKEMSLLLQLVSEVRSAVESRHPRRSDAPSSRTRPKVSASELVDDVQSGACVLDPDPVPGPLPSGIVVDRGPVPNEGRHAEARIPSAGRQL